MDYCGVFRPIFVYITHLIRNQTDGARLPFPFASVREDLQGLILAVFQTPGSSGPEFDDAWFAVRCWLCEKLAPLHNGTELCGRLVDIPENGGSEFFLRLNRHLEHDSRSLVMLYATCLELGFRGYYARPGRETELEGYRAACRALLLRARNAPPADTPLRAKSENRCLTAALWLFPVAATILLYWLYRSALSDLYTSVVG